MARTSDPDLAERRRRQIAEAALTCFRKRGFHQASMQEICAQAQISPGALYRYFPSKNHLIAAIAEDVQANVESAIAQAGAGGDIFAVLDAIGRSMIEEMFDPADGALVAEVMAEASRDLDLAARLAAINRQTQARLAALIGAAQTDGRLAASLSPQEAAVLMMAVIDGLGVKQALDPHGRAGESMAAYRAFINAVFAPTPALNVAPGAAVAPASAKSRPKRPKSTKKSTKPARARARAAIEDGAP
jgi:TetR/AcrR family transcriptional repressor of uid operon